MSTKYESVLRWGASDGQRAPTNLQDFLDALSEAGKLVPEAYREAATIELDAHSDSDGALYVQVHVGYDRPLTAEEVAEKHNKEAAFWVQELKRAEARALQCRRNLEANSPAREPWLMQQVQP